MDQLLGRDCGEQVMIAFICCDNEFQRTIVAKNLPRRIETHRRPCVLWRWGVAPAAVTLTANYGKRTIERNAVKYRKRNSALFIFHPLTVFFLMLIYYIQREAL